jgi:integrase
MAKVRARPDNGMLFFDFYYRGVRCREQTALPDTAENRRRVQTLLNRITREIAQGAFDYAATFPGSPRAARFAASAGAPDADRTQGAASTVSADTPTFAAFATTWRAEMAPQWRRKHRSGVDDIFTKHLLPFFGEKPLFSITKPDVLAFRAALAACPGRTDTLLSASRVNKVMTLLRQCLTEASDRFGLPDPCKGIKRLKAKRPEIHPFSLDEVEMIRGTIRADFKHYTTVRFFTGMRTGEINGLKWKHVDFDNGLILVRETFSDGESEDQAKTESSMRDIPMLPQVREALMTHREQRHPTSDYVFCSREGNPIDAHNFANRVWYPLLRYLGIAKRRPYQTRHTTATLMLASGENPEWIAKLMGHANTQMLFTVYSRFVPNLTRQDGLAIAGLLSNRTAPPPAPDLLAALKSLPPDALAALLRQAKTAP